MELISLFEIPHWKLVRSEEKKGAEGRERGRTRERERDSKGGGGGLRGEKWVFSKEGGRVETMVVGWFWGWRAAGRGGGGGATTRDTVFPACW